MRNAAGDTAGEWRALRGHWRRRRGETLRGLFEKDGRRFGRFSAEAGGVLLDFSKTAINGDALRLLVGLARAAGVVEMRRGMFAGDAVNQSENRPALHVALRAPDDARVVCGGANIIAEVARERRAMLVFAEQLRREKKYSDIVNIGIGGSDLGPKTATEALTPWCDGPRAHYVSNIDGAHLHDTLQKLNPRRTFFVFSSKTFTTAETLANAEDALRWLQKTVGKTRALKQCAAATAAPQRARAFGVENVFRYWQWVGGRYSLWGAVGLPLACAVGKRRFNEMLQGARLMDEHFRRAPLQKNLPALLAMVGVWHRNVCGYQSRVVVPYEQRLHLLPSYLQQLDMESNGKSVLQNGKRAPHSSAPVVWGAAGTNAQHAFFQMLHQGADVVPCEFIVAARGGSRARRRVVVANCLAQSAALMNGRANADGHRNFAGNRPSVTLMIPELTPQTLGMLLALYEHRAFVEGVLWGVNPFDQFGVELGKETALKINAALAEGGEQKQDSSTRGLMAQYNKLA